MIKEEWQTGMVPVTKRPLDTLSLSLFSFSTLLFVGETNSFCQSLRINKDYWQIADCVSENKIMWTKYAKTELHLRQLCDPFRKQLSVCEDAGCMKRRTPQAFRRGDPGGLGYACTPSPHSQTFTPYLKQNMNAESVKGVRTTLLKSD